MFTVYTKPNCPYCVKAKTLLKNKGKEFEEIHLDVGQPKAENVNYIDRDLFLSQFPNQRTMPLILENEKIIGGFTDLETHLDYDF